MNKRRDWPVLVVVGMVLVWGPADASVINVISQEYSIEGLAWAGGCGGPPCEELITVSFHETSSLPVSRYASADGFGWAWMYASASGGVTATAAWVSGQAYGGDIGPAHFVSASASASMTFTPLVDVMQVSAEGEAPSSVKLVDVTGGATWSLPFIHLAAESVSFLMPFDLSHTYVMSFAAYADNGLRPSVSLSLTSVPEPATLLLLGTGLAVLGGIAWRRHRRG